MSFRGSLRGRRAVIVRRSGILAAGAAGSLTLGAIALATVPAGPAQAAQAGRFPVAPFSETFYYIGQTTQTVTPPADAVSAMVVIHGASGGNVCDIAACGKGGYGAEVTGTLPLPLGARLVLSVAGRGGNANGRTNPGDGGWGLGSGGRGGSGSSGSEDGAGGGGASAIHLSSCLPTCISLTYAIAGGGGAGGAVGYFPSVDSGGNGGNSASSAGNGAGGRGPNSGGGGTGGNLGGNGGAGGGGISYGGSGGGGGAGYSSGSGGGGGGFGGGGGGGGGAGSSYSASLTSPRVTGGQTADGNGYITITWNFAFRRLGPGPAARWPRRVVPGVPLGQ
jgi:hypothetical protein